MKLIMDVFAWLIIVVFVLPLVGLALIVFSPVLIPLVIWNVIEWALERIINGEGRNGRESTNDDD